MKVNPVTSDLKPYPAEELTRIKKRLIEQDKTVYDFGTGDPRIPVWPPIREALIDAIPEISQYPSIGGTEVLRDAHIGYLKRRFDLTVGEELEVIPSGGSKEAVFHAALSLVGRSNGKKIIIYPDPGYPVYQSATLFAGGTPYPVALRPDNGFLLEPWDLPEFVQKDAAALWANYPHNPTGATAPADYWEKLVTWARETDTVLLSDDCYNDIYMEGEEAPGSPLQFGAEMVLSFMSLSKRSGMTGFRSGMIAGDPELLKSMLRARANMGLATPTFIQSAAAVAWNDDDHVAARRKIFSERMALAAPVFQELGLIDEAPRATFYLWTRIPEKYGTNDVKYCTALAEKGVIASPSQWLSEGVKGYARFALVPDAEELAEALEIIKTFCGEPGNETDADSDEDAPEVDEQDVDTSEEDEEGEDAED